MEKIKSKLFTRRNILIILFVVFLSLRIFVNQPAMSLGADPVKYLEVSKNFPYHTLSNNQLYIDHGPFYPYVIYLFTFIFQNEFIASIFISLLSSGITFFVAYKLFMMLSKNFYVTFIAMIFLTLSVELIVAAHKPLKESFTVMLIISAIYFYTKGVKFNDKKLLLLATLFGSALALTVDHVIFLFPSFILSYIFFNS